MVRPEPEMTGVYGPVLLTTGPAPAGFVSRYFLCLSPVVLLLVSLLLLSFLKYWAVSLIPSLDPSLGLIVPDLPLLIDILLVLISPVGIFLFFIYLGDALNRTAIWTGAALTLLCSVLGGLIQVHGMNMPILSLAYLFAVSQWVAYLVQPFSVIAAVVLLAGTELFRRSITYTLTRDVVIITGGIWSLVENVIPLSTITRIVMIQDRPQQLFHTGTVVLQGVVYGNDDIDIRDHTLSGERSASGITRGSLLSWQEGSRDPLVCLFGVRDPEGVKTQIEKARTQRSENDLK